MNAADPTSSIRRRAEALTAPLPPLLVAAERVATTVAQGVHGRRRVGTGESFWQFRRYEPGDGVQRIDWRQTAKSQTAYVREYEWEASQTVWLWRDRSASMAYRSDSRLAVKAERADLLLLALATLLSRAGERVALLGGQTPPATGRVNLTRIAADLIAASSRQEAGVDPSAADGMPPVARLPRHAELVLLGDFLDPLDEIAERVSGFASCGVRGHLLQVLDPAEQLLPFRGRVRFAGLEREPEEVIPRVEAVRRDYLDRLRAQQDGLTIIARQLGWSFIVHRTDHPAQAALLALFLALAEPATRSAKRF